MERYIFSNLICMPAPVPVSWRGEGEEAGFNSHAVAEYFFKEAGITAQNREVAIITVPW